MRIISHRGNLNGPKPDRENEPSYIDEAIRLGLDAEVDVRIIDDKYYLGHDGPDYEVDFTWLLERKDSLWIHCKNLEAARWFSTFITAYSNLRCFSSVSDPFCFMTKGYLWLNDVEIKPTYNCIVPLLSIDDIKRYKFMGRPWGVCTDYPMELK
jgi:hypothetical protein